MIAILKEHSLAIRLGMLLILTLSSVYLSYVAQAVKQQIITSDDRFSEHLNNAIKLLLEHGLNQTNLQRFDLLKSSFPMVDELKVRMVGLNKIYVQFVAQDLQYRLGSNFVLTSKGEVFLASCFSNQALRSLPFIYLHTNPEVATDIELQQINFLLKLPDFVVTPYEVHWHGLNQIVLINKENNNHQIIIRSDQLITSELLATAQQLFTDYLGHITKKCSGVVKADLRFAEQIIMAC